MKGCVMKRRDLVGELEKNGFVSVGGSKHEKFKKSNTTVLVKRHDEIPDQIAKKILREAGLR